MDENNTTPSPEELKEEQDTLAEVADDTLRSEIVSSLGLEETDENKELIDKAVAREKASRTRLSKAIKQKIDWRTKAQGTQPPKPKADEGATEKPLTPEQIRKEAEAGARNIADQEFFDESEFPEEIEKVIRDEAKRLGISARKASRTDFVQFKIEQDKKAKEADEAADNGSKKNGGKTKVKSIDASKPLNVSDYDLSTPEGRQKWEDAKAAHKKARDGK